MIFFILTMLFWKLIYALNCSVSQIHIAQGINSSSIIISWLTPDNCFSHVSYGINSLDNTVFGSS